LFNDGEGRQLIRWTTMERASHENCDGIRDFNMSVQTTSRSDDFFFQLSHFVEE